MAKRKRTNNDLQVFLFGSVPKVANKTGGKGSFDPSGNV
jgi:hypothetical protein